MTRLGSGTTGGVEFPAAPARFNSENRCTSPGWATYYRNLPLRRQRVCGFLGHIVPDRAPSEADSRRYGRCRRCSVPMRYFFAGESRFGGFRLGGAPPYRGARRPFDDLGPR